MRTTLLLALLIAVGAVQAESPTPNVTRDGRWLRTAIQQYEMFSQKNGAQTIQDTAGGVFFTGYLRGVIDVQLNLALKARVLTENAYEAAKQKRASREWAKGSDDGMFILDPLEKSDFGKKAFQMDQYVQMIKTYLEKHPESWDQDAEALIGFALWAAFPSK